MSSTERFLSGFAQNWRDEHERLWQADEHGDRTARFAAVEQAWREACEQWWNNLRHVVPDPLVRQLEHALRQTQVCLGLALRGECISAATLAQMLSPVAGLHTALQAQEARTNHEQTHHNANLAVLGRLAQIMQSTLEAAREGLRDPCARTPRELYVHCANIAETLYLEQAASEEFARLIGRWVNTHADMLVARRQASVATENEVCNAAIATAESCATQPGTTQQTRFTAIDKSSAAKMSETAESLNLCIARQTHEFGDKLAAGVSSLAALHGNNSPAGSSCEVVFECEGVKLLRYSHRASDAGKQTASLPPLLIVYSLINRPYILDLNEDRSLIRALCDTGRDVHVIDWGYPRAEDAKLGLDDYINRYLHACVKFLQNECNSTTVDLTGICQGGPFALCYTALEPQRVRKLAMLAAPVDFHADGFLLTEWLRHIDVEALVNKLGNVPGYLLNWGFLALKPLSHTGIKALELLDLLDSPRELASYAQMERWLQDNPDQAGRAFSEFTQIFVRNNALVNSTARIGSRPVDLLAVHQPVLNIYATRDHIVPRAASSALAKLIPNAQCTDHHVDSGHIGLLAARRKGSFVAETLGDWFSRLT